MPAVTRFSDECTGHSSWPPRPSAEGSPDVYVNNLAAHRMGDLWEVHCNPAMSCHDSILAMGSGTVFVNSKPLGRIGDPIECGSMVAQGSPDVFAGD